MKHIMRYGGALLLMILFMGSCKLSDDILIDYTVLDVSGYSRMYLERDTQTAGPASLYLLASVRNDAGSAVTVTNWRFIIKHDIVTLCEVGPANAETYQVTALEDATIPAGEIREFYISTTEPEENHRINSRLMGFDEYTPDTVIVEIEITAEDGSKYNISKKGTFTLHREVERYSCDPRGRWKLTRVVRNQQKGAQELVMVGSRAAGEYVIYQWQSSTVFDQGRYSCSADGSMQMTADDGDNRYWGDFTDADSLEGTLIMDDGQTTRTGSWTAARLQD